jgi:hypothetical protein
MSDGRNKVAELEAEADLRRSEIERLRAALRAIRDCPTLNPGERISNIHEIARATLEGKE